MREFHFQILKLSHFQIDFLYLCTPKIMSNKVFMGSLGKWIGGGLGWAFGGPIGALIGFTLGSMFDGTNVSVSTSMRSNSTTEGDFKMSLLVLMACIMKADGRVDKSELAVVKKFLVANFGEQGALEALQILKNLLDQPIDETDRKSVVYGKSVDLGGRR